MTGINVALMSKTVVVELLLAALTEHTHLLVQHPLELVGRYVRHTLIKVPLLIGAPTPINRSTLWQEIRRPSFTRKVH